MQIGNEQVSVNKRQAVLFFCVINQGIFASLQTINSFPSERALALRERAAGTYHVSAYVRRFDLACDGPKGPTNNRPRLINH